jgi:Helix-turn-helix domain
MYQLLLRIRDGRLNFNGFVIHFFAIGSSRISDYIYALNESVAEPLVRELGYRLQELEEQLPDEKTASVSSAVVQIIHHATNVIQQHALGDHIPQKAGITLNPELTNLFQQLRQAVQELPAEKRTEAIEIAYYRCDSIQLRNDNALVLKNFFSQKCYTFRLAFAIPSERFLLVPEIISTAPKALKIKDAAQYLGGLSVTTVRRLIKRGLIRPNRALRHILIPVHELDCFLAGGQQ